MKYMTFIGCDPDLHATAFAAVNQVGKPVFLGCCKAIGARGNEAIGMMIEEQRTWLKDYCDHGDLTNVMAVAVEGQHHILGYTKNPMSISLLAAAAGGALQLLHGCWPFASLHYPPVKTWKGDVPKRINQARTFKRVGWEYTRTTHKNPSERYCVPKIPSTQRDILGLRTVKNKGDWKHVGDALGIALWCRNQYAPKLSE